MWFDTTNSYEMKFKESDLIPYNSVCLKGERVYNWVENSFFIRKDCNLFLCLNMVKFKAIKNAK